MTFDTLRMFLTVCQENSFSAAARKLYISASAVTQKMSQLEGELGFLLFNRAYNGVTLTEAGEQFSRGVGKALRIMDNTLQACAQISDRTKDVINVGVHTTSLMSAYQSFERENPGLTCHYSVFQESEAARMLDGLLDGSLHIIEWPTMPRLETQGVRFLPRYRAEVCCAMAYNHPLASRETLSLRELKGEHVRVYGLENQEVIADALDEALLAQGINGVEYVPLPGTSNAVLEACRRGELVLVSRAYAKMLPLKTISLCPNLWVDFGLAYLVGAGEPTRKLLEFIRQYDISHGVDY